MQYLLTIDDASREYLLAIVQGGVIRDAAKLPDLDPKRDTDQYAKARAALRVGATPVGELSPARVDVAAAGPQPPAAALVEATQRCVHGIDFADPCAHCNPPQAD